MNILQNAAAFLGDPPAAAQDCNLIDRRELALVAVERSQMPMVVTDPRQADNPIVLANQAFLDLTGFGAEEVIGKNCRFLQGKGTAPSDMATLSKALRCGDDNIVVELINYRKDGSPFINLLDIWAVRDEQEKLLYYFASQRDVTAQRKAEKLEANERRLLMEVDHRSMNVLALINSIVDLSKADNVKSFSRAIIGRIGSLALAHRLLAEHRWQALSLAALVEPQFSPPSRSHVTFGGDDVLLLPDIVQPIALVIHEFLSNAQIHGALSHEYGQIKLTWTGEHETLMLHWHEISDALMPSPIKDGLGFQIVRSVVEQQLQGSLTIDINYGVLDAIIVIPYALVLAA